MCLISLTECLQQSNFLSLRTSVFQQISLARNILYPNSCYHISNCKVNLFINISYRNFSYKIRLSTPAPARFRTKPPANCAKSLEFPRARLAPAYLAFGFPCVSHKCRAILCETQAARGDCGVGGVPAAGGFWRLW